MDDTLNREEPKIYSIGEFSRKAGVSSHFLKFYEEKGVFDPVVKENGYRYYGIWDASSVLECRWMKNVGFSVQEIAQNFKENTPRELMQALENHQESLEQQIFLQQMHLQGLKKLREGLRFCEQGSWSIRDVPEQWFLPHTMDGQFQEDERIYDQLPEWLKWMPIALSAQKIWVNEDGELHEEWGMGVERSQAEQIGLVQQPPMQTLHMGKVLEWHHSSAWMRGKREESVLYEMLQEKARKLNLIPEPFVFRKLFCYTEKAGDCWEHCVYQVPVRLPE